MKKSSDFRGFAQKTEEMLMCSSHISINGNHCAVIDGCRQIVECTEIMAKLLTASYEIEIWGSGLKLSCFSQGSVEVKGTVEEIKIQTRARRIRNALGL